MSTCTGLNFQKTDQPLSCVYLTSRERGVLALFSALKCASFIFRGGKRFKTMSPLHTHRIRSVALLLMHSKKNGESGRSNVFPDQESEPVGAIFLNPENAGVESGAFSQVSFSFTQGTPVTFGPNLAVNPFAASCVAWRVQGHLAHKKTPTPLGST